MTPINLRAIRGTRTQTDMARLLGVSLRTYTRREKAGNAPHAWALALGYDGIGETRAPTPTTINQS